MKAAKLGNRAPKKNKRKILLIVIPILLVALAGGAVWFFFFGGKKSGDGRMMSFGNERGTWSGYSNANLQGMLMAYGVTNMGTVAETFDVTSLDTELQIEEVYVASGDELKAGDKVLKLTEDSVKAAREELQDKLQDAELSYRAGAITYEQSKIEAAYDRDSAQLGGEQADAVYKDSMADVTQEVEAAQEKLDKAKAQIQTYSEYVNNDTYREYFKLDEYQKLYDENLKILTDNMDAWGISWSQVVGQGGGMESVGASSGSSSGSSSSGGFPGGSSSGSSGSGFSGMTGGDFSGMTDIDISGMAGGTKYLSEGTEEGGTLLAENATEGGETDNSGNADGAGTSGEGSGDSGSSSESAAVDAATYNQWVSILKNLYSVLEQNKKDLDNAQSEYDNAVACVWCHNGVHLRILPGL